MQKTVYNSDEVKIKLIDLLVSTKRFNEANSSTMYDRLIELREFIDKMELGYIDLLENDFVKMTKVNKGESAHE